jgi:hypothetical protein
VVHCQIDYFLKILTDNEDLKYQLHQHVKFLAHLCANWQSKTNGVPFPFTDDVSMSWGPSESDLLQALTIEHTASWEREEGEEYEDQGDEGNDSDGEADGELLDAFESFALTEAWSEEVQNTLSSVLTGSGVSHRSVIQKSPRKRGRSTAELD